MANLTFAQLREAGVFAVLARLFPTEIAVHALLVDLGADRTRDLPRLPTAGNLSPELYWRLICDHIDNGMFSRVTLSDLVAEASRRYPGSSDLRDLLGDELRVVCLLAGPDQLDRARLREEHRTIQEIARQRGLRVLEVSANPATRANDVLGDLLRSKPHIVHFAGHGTSNGLLVFEDEQGRPAPVPVSSLQALLGAACDNLSCVVLGSCFSAAYAEALLPSARFVAGSTTTLDDGAALEFTRGFYTALGIGGASVPDAFSAGLAQMVYRGYDTSGMILVPSDREVQAPT